MAELAERVAVLEAQVAELRARLLARPTVAARLCSMAGADVTKLEDLEWTTPYRLICPGCGRRVGLHGRHWISRHFAPKESS